MDAATLYILVGLASGEAHVALKEPLNGRTCARAQIDEAAARAFHEQIAAKPKLIYLFCTDANGDAPPVGVSPPASEDQSSLPAPDATGSSRHPAYP